MDTRVLSASKMAEKTLRTTSAPARQQPIKKRGKSGETIMDYRRMTVVEVADDFVISVCLCRVFFLIIWACNKWR